MSELPPDDDDDDDDDDDMDESLPPVPPDHDEDLDLPKLPSDAEGGEDERLAYELMAADHAAQLLAQQQLDQDARLARQLAGDSSQEASPRHHRHHRRASPPAPTPAAQRAPAAQQKRNVPTANAALHRRFPGFEPSVIDAMLVANNGDVQGRHPHIHNIYQKP
jgi:hypothetical protein